MDYHLLDMLHIHWDLKVTEALISALLRTLSRILKKKKKLFEKSWLQLKVKEMALIIILSL